jgi:hypothetical protein
MLIKTTDDWWLLVESHWQNILNIFANVDAPLGTDENGHWWSDEIGGKITRHEKALIEVLLEARENGDHQTLHAFFEKVWVAAPDLKYIHSWPSWSIFCDLCSEYWVFETKS